MIWVFKTFVQTEQEIATIAPLLDAMILPNGRWNFDLQDCDNVLRVENPAVEMQELIKTLLNVGFACEELPD